MTQSKLKEIAAKAIKKNAPHMSNTLELWCEFDPKTHPVTFASHLEGITTCALFEFANPVFYFDEMTGFSFNVNGDQAAFSISYGRYCTNPTMATTYAKRAKDAVSALGWSLDERFNKQSSLILSSSFSFDSDDDLLQKLNDRIAMLNDDLLVNELRPFLHYFETNSYRDAYYS